MYRKRFIITESEKKHIRNLYGLITEQETFTGCTFSEKNNDLPDYNDILRLYNNKKKVISNEITKHAQEFIKNVPNLKSRSACQAGLNKIRPLYKDKKFIIVDQLKNTAYFFSSDGNIVGSWVIAGKDVPSEKWKDYAMSSSEEEMQSKWEKLPTNIKSKEGAWKQTGSRFVPPNVYSTGIGFSEPSYKGTDKETKLPNVFNLSDLKTGKPILQALHGVKPDQNRLSALNSVSNIPMSSDTKVNLDLSTGCINFPEDFVKEHRDKFQDAYVFVIKSDQNDYYVFNPKPIIDNPGKCYSNDVLGVEII